MNIVTTALEKSAKVLVDIYKAHAPRILTGICVAAIGTTSVTAITGTVKAVRACDEKKKELKTDKLTVGELIKTCWKYYIPMGVSMAVGTGAAIGACIEGEHKAAILASALQCAENSSRDILEASKEVVGKEKTEEIQEKAAEKAVQRATTADNAIQNFGTGEDLIVEPVTGTIMRGDINTIERGTLEFNKRIITYQEEPSWGEWWEAIGVYTPSLLVDVPCTNPIEFAKPMAIEIESLGKPAFLLRYRSTPFDMEELIRKIHGRFPWD